MARVKVVIQPTEDIKILDSVKGHSGSGIGDLSCKRIFNSCISLQHCT